MSSISRASSATTPTTAAVPAQTAGDKLPSSSLERPDEPRRARFDASESHIAQVLALRSQRVEPSEHD